MQYDLSAAGILRRLGFGQPVHTEWLEKLKQTYPLPKVYEEFLTLAANCPVLGTSDLWTGKMAHGMSAPHGTFFDQLQEEISDRTGRWRTPPTQYESALLALAPLPREQWPLKDYLLIGSDYACGVAVFGIRAEDLSQNDPPVWQHTDWSEFSDWKIESETVSDFLRRALFEALAGVDYDTAGDALEKMGWRCEEYFDPEAGDWATPKTVLKQQGISYRKLKKYPSQVINEGPVFCCYDEVRNVFFVGSSEDGEMLLTAVNREDAERVFPDFFGEGES